MNENISWGKIVVLVVAIVGIGIMAFLWGKKSDDVAVTPITPVIQPAKKEEMKPAETINSAIEVPMDWKTYADSRYGFELKTPYELKPFSSYGTVGSSSGKNYETNQITVSSPFIKIIKGFENPSVEAYGSIAYTAEPQMILNGITWNVFYDSKAGLEECDMSIFQTLMPNGKDVLWVEVFDEKHCPGNPEEAVSVHLLKQILSTFKFTK